MIEDLSGPALRLFDIIAGQVDATGRAELAEAWVLREMGCGSDRLRRYRCDLKRAGLADVRLFGSYLRVQLVPAAREKCDAATRAAQQRAKSVTPTLFDTPADAREKCDATPSDDPQRAKSVTLEPPAREKCDAQRASSSRQVSFEPSQRAKSVTLEPPAREKCDAQRAKSVTLTGRKEGRTFKRVKLINKSFLPSPLPPASHFSRAEVAVDDPVTVPAVAFAVAPASNPDYERNRELLEDDELEIGFDAAIEVLARGYAFEDLLRQVFAQRRASERRRQRGQADFGPGALVARLGAHLVNPADWRAGPITVSDRHSDLYRRHVVIVAPAPEPEDSSENFDPAPAPQPAPTPRPNCEMWDIARSHLRLQLPQSTYDTWVRDTSAELADDGHLVVHVASQYAQQFLNLRLRSLVEQTIISIVGERIAVEFVSPESAS